MQKTLLVAALLAGSAFVASAQTPAPVPTAANQVASAPLPISEYVKNPQYMSPQISPSGKHLLVLVRWQVA
jgi:hypothetical protein